MGKPIVAFGAQVYAKEDGSVVIVPPDVEYAPKPTEKRISYVVNINIDFPIGKPVIAKIELFPSQTTIIEAVPQYRFLDEHGHPRQISQVIFDDGTDWVPCDDEQWNPGLADPLMAKFRRMTKPSLVFRDRDGTQIGPATPVTDRLARAGR